jgi:FAD:protein FMN transferase
MGMDDKFLATVVSKQFKKFGTEIDFQIVVEDKGKIVEAEKNLEQAEKKCSEIENIFSRFNPDSELMNFNAQLGVAIPASAQLLEIAKLALSYNQETEGYFDPRIIGELEYAGYNCDFEKIKEAKISAAKKVINFERSLRVDLIIEENKLTFNERMDFTGIVKGYAVDQIAKFFKQCGWKNFLVDCGGDMFFSGKEKKGNPWYIDIEGITYQNLMLELQEKAIATSGIGKRKWEIAGKRFHHLVNPKDCGRYCFDLKSVTVVADCAMGADVWAKTLFVMGASEAKVFAQERKLACAILDYRGGVWISTELKKYLHKPKNHE